MLYLLFAAAISTGIAAVSTSPDAAGLAAARARVAAVVERAEKAGEFTGEVRVTWSPSAQMVIAASPPGTEGDALIKAKGRYRLASQTKQVTAVLVLQAVEAGKVTLDTTAGSMLPDAGAPVRPVTVRQLLQHTSGLANPSDGVADDVVPPFYARTGRGAGDHQAAMKGVCSGTAKAQPGAGFSYNNCDYIVLGAMLERIYKQPFAEIVETRISRPLGLSWRVAGDTPALPAPAVGYGADGKPELFQNVATYGASGALIGTTQDVARWDAAILDHRLLSPASTALMFTPDPKLYGEALSTWAFDSDLGDGQKVRVWERQGDIGGTRLLNLIMPSEHLSVVIAANTEKADLFNTYGKKGLGYAVLQAALVSPPSP